RSSNHRTEEPEIRLPSLLVLGIGVNGRVLPCESATQGKHRAVFYGRFSLLETGLESGEDWASEARDSPNCTRSSKRCSTERARDIRQSSLAFCRSLRARAGSAFCSVGMISLARITMAPKL